MNWEVFPTSLFSKGVCMGLVFTCKMFYRIHQWSLLGLGFSARFCVCFFKQARSVIVTEPLNTTYQQAKMALRGEAVGGQGGRRGSRRRLPGSVLEGLRLPPPKELGWRKVGCLWRPRGFTSSSWMKPSVGFVHDFRRSLVSTIHDVDLIVCLPALYNSSKRPTIHFTSRLSCSSRPSYLTVTRTRRFCSDPPPPPELLPAPRTPAGDGDCSLPQHPLAQPLNC